ncbi:NAD-P-binding protein [Trametes polyzona]|nr:NAD-P-binding protein [Trametes polyzona]
MSPHAAKVVLVTGCSEGGIGFALCKEYAAQGCKVYATARRVEAMNKLVHPNIERLRMDVTDESNIASVVAEVVEQEGRIDILVNNAGVGCSGPVVEVDFERILQTYNTNVFGILRTAKAVIPHMAARKSGTIVNIGSVAGEMPLPFSGIYASSKAAVHSLTASLHMECRPLGVAVVLVAAGGVRTNITSNASAHFRVPPGSLYAGYPEAVLGGFDPEQTAGAMPAEEFARVVVGRSLAEAPARVVSVGQGAGMARAVAWLPRGVLLRLLWSQFVEKPMAALAKSR